MLANVQPTFQPVQIDLLGSLATPKHRHVYTRPRVSELLIYLYRTGAHIASLEVVIHEQVRRVVNIVTRVALQVSCDSQLKQGDCVVGVYFRIPEKRNLSANVCATCYAVSS